jgi:hypothetical protein
VWRREGLKVPQKQPKRGRLWLNDGSCIRLRAERRNHVWAYDFAEDRTHDGRKYRMLTIVDEFTHECLAIRVKRKLKSIDVIEALADLFLVRGAPQHVRSDNGPEFVAQAVQDWIAAAGAKTAYIELGSPWGETRTQLIRGINCRVERLHRELQRKAQRRAAQRRDLLLPRRGEGRDRKVAAPLQRHPPTRIARLPRACARGVRAGARRMAGSASAKRSAGHAPASKGGRAQLALNPNYFVGADHGHPARPWPCPNKSRQCAASPIANPVSR